ncbi:hypothetical protein PMAYCL1PPCAC_17431, partial [Pristionchus mayeri]
IPLLLSFPGIELMHKWKKEYGAIYTYWLGPYPIVTVNEINLVQRMFVQNGDNYADRSPLGSLSEKYR